MALLQRGNDNDDELAVILLHVRELLNTRRGASALCAEYGLPDSNDLLQIPGPPGRLMCRAIRECLDRHEPRLQILGIDEQQAEAGAVRLDFLLRVRLRTDREHRTLQLVAAMDIGGRMTVRIHDRVS